MAGTAPEFGLGSDQQAMAGVYRVLGIVAHLDAGRDAAGNIPGGYELLFQTCLNGSSEMRFVAMKKVG